jgi:hypothetical protein
MSQVTGKPAQGKGTSRRPDPRISQTKELVIRATYELIADVGFVGATVERIAERSGVARSSIYRHWPVPLPALHMAALEPLDDRPEDVEPTGDVRVDLLQYLSHVCSRLNDPKYSGVQLALLSVAHTNAVYAQAHRRQLAVRTRVLRNILRSGVADGALCECTDVDLEAKMLLAPLTYVCLIEHLKVKPAIAVHAVDALLSRTHRMHDSDAPHVSD